MARKPKESNLACKEWVPSIELLQQNISRIIHPKINGRATVNLNIYSIIVSIVRLKKRKAKIIKK